MTFFQAEGKYVDLPPWAIFFAVILMFSSLVVIPIVALLKYFNIIEKKGKRKLERTKNLKKNFNKEDDSFELEALHRPLHSVESNTISLATEASEDVFRA